MAELNTLQPLRFFPQFVLPAVFDDSLSYYEVLSKVVNTLNSSEDSFNAIISQVNLNTQEIAALKELFEKFQESGFDDYYAEQVAKWIDDNLDYIFTHTAKQVFFGLNEQGYFVAYVPKSWNDIIYRH